MDLPETESREAQSLRSTGDFNHEEAVEFAQVLRERYPDARQRVIRRILIEIIIPED